MLRNLLCTLVAFGLVALCGRASIAQCAGDGFVQDPLNPQGGYMYRWTTDAGDCNGNCTMNFTITSVFDDALGSSGPAYNGAYTSVRPSSQNGVWAGWTVGGCGYINLTFPNPTYSEMRNTASPFGYPPTNGIANGAYIWTCSVQDQTFHTSSISMWIVNGAWTPNDPGPGLQPNPAYGGGAYTSGTGALTVNVTADSAAEPGAQVNIVGPVLSGGPTNSAGAVTFRNLPAGNYTITVTGSHNRQSPATGTQQDSGSTTAFVGEGDSAQVSVAFNDTGQATWTGGSNTSNGSGGVIADVLTALFIPQQADVDNVKSSLSNLYSWGPFNLVQQFLTAMQSTPSGHILLTLPQFAWQHQDSSGTGGYGFYSNAQVPVTDMGFSESTGFTIVRNIEGLGVILAWMVWMTRMLTPQYRL